MLMRKISQINLYNQVNYVFNKSNSISSISVNHFKHVYLKSISCFVRKILNGRLKHVFGPLTLEQIEIYSKFKRRIFAFDTAKYCS